MSRLVSPPIDLTVQVQPGDQRDQLLGPRAMAQRDVIGVVVGQGADARRQLGGFAQRDQRHAARVLHLTLDGAVPHAGNRLNLDRTTNFEFDILGQRQQGISLLQNALRPLLAGIGATARPARRLLSRRVSTSARLRLLITCLFAQPKPTLLGSSSSVRVR